ncbi:MAG: M28 family peptidase [Bryobacteraceae bacterium]
MRGIVYMSMLSGAALLLAQEGAISASRIREDVRFLSSDALEGRGVGQRGGDLATEYLAHQFAQAGAQPAGRQGSYYQDVPLVGVETQGDRTELSAEADGKRIDFAWLEDFVGVGADERPDARFGGEAVFVGHGIHAPEWNWDDFKGLDLTGKVLVLFTNEPPGDDPKFFDGRALTYYGRWVYKYEEGLRRGARAVLILHTDQTAGYGWDVVRSSWGRETPFLKLAAGEPALALEGWLSRAAAEKLLGLVGKNVDAMLAAADRPDFKPIPLGIRIAGRLHSKVRDLRTRNVAAMVPGSDPNLKNEFVVYSAHWDHLGIAAPVKGDSVYNGAIDNATGCGILLELARAWAALPHRPKRSALFLSVTAEEAVMKGSDYYAAHPLVPAEKTAIDLNYDAVYPWGRAKEIVISGAERTTALAEALAIARRMNLAVKPDAHPEQGHYFRSDHFSFARAGIPAFSIGVGTEFYGKPPGYGERMFQEYNTLHYHQPSDEFHDDWDFTATAQAAEYGFLLGTTIANQEKLPDWIPGDTFRRR